jgi:exopolysaccharide biosynthesis polyprenyl glycosylphosphotransferase
VTAADDVLFGTGSARPPEVVDVTDATLAAHRVGVGARLAGVRASVPAQATPRRGVVPARAQPVPPAGDHAAGSSSGSVGGPGALIQIEHAAQPDRPSRPWVFPALLGLADAAGVAIGWSSSVFVADPGWRLAVSWPDAVLALALAAPAWWAALALVGGYARDVADRALGVPAVLDAACRVAAPVLLVAVAVWPGSARGVLLAVAVGAGADAVLRAAVVRLRPAAVHPGGGLRVLVAGSGPAITAVLDTLTGRSGRGIRPVGRCVTDLRAVDDPGLPGPASLGSSSSGAGAASPEAEPTAGVDLVRRRLTSAARAARADAVLIADPAALGPGGLRRLAWSLEGSGLRLLVGSGLADVTPGRLRLRSVAGLPVLQVEPPCYSGARRLAKEAIDRLGAAVLLILLAPVLACTALAVRVADSGPVIFRQARVGRHGQPFTMYKFRSMRVDAERWRPLLERFNDHSGGALFKMRHDPRVTAVGRLIRRLSVDELPQLVNVLRGEMSLVGPRPSLPSEVEKYETDTLRRLRVKPGLTGLWQVSGRADLNWRESVRLDLSYVDNWSVGLDLRILVRTLLVVVRGSGAR